jgi:hypothetical protein
MGQGLRDDALARGGQGCAQTVSRSDENAV